MNHHRFLVNIRPIKPEEITLLSDFLYEAIYQPAGRPLLPRTTIQHPSLWCYIESFGSRKGDACLVAESDALVVGAIWVRYMHGCGYVDDDTPEISLSLYPAYRNNGIGSQLLNSMLDLLKNNGVKKVSLSVSRTNRAVSLYKRFGFEIIDRDRDLTTADYLMQRLPLRGTPNKINRTSQPFGEG